MILGRVVGVVWGTREASELDGKKKLRVRPVDVHGEPCRGDGEIVAIDDLAAGPGDLVLVAIGSRVRDLTIGATVPTKAVVVAIVDGTALASAAAP